MKLDKRRKYYLVLDCETATLPFSYDLPEEQKKTIAIAKPLIYDIGWTIVDRKGEIYAQENFLISEIFSVPSIFNTAYYKDKRSIYLDLLERGEIELVTWRTATEHLDAALAQVESVGAYNAMFDFKKAIAFTEQYINALYSADYFNWMERQKKRCDYILNHPYKEREREHEFDPYVFIFHGKTYPLFDLWGLSCKYLLNNPQYKMMCYENGWISQSGKYFRTSAETAYRFISNNCDFDEAHTALDDARIESELFAAIVKPNIKNLEIGIIYFPFRMLGRADI